MHRAAVTLFFFLALVAGIGAHAPIALAEKRVALVIGNSAYKHAAPLRNPRNDAQAMSAELEKLGFEVVSGTDLSYAEMRRAMRDFAHKLKQADVALLFYAGHGLQVQGNNFLAPVDAELREELDLEYEAIKLSTIVAQMERSAKTNLVLLDACRDNPLARNLARSMGSTRSGSIGRGLARVETGVGTLIAFATQPGNVAYDGDGKNSPFTTGLLKHISTPGLDVALVMRRVRQEVIDQTGGVQIPWNNSSLTGSFMFNERAATPAVDHKAVELALWQAANIGRTKALYGAYLEKYPHGAYANEAKAKMDAIRKGEEERKQAEAERRAKAEAERQKLKAERERMAKEREEFARRLAQLESQAEARAKKTQEQAELEKVAKERDAYLEKLKKLETEAQSLAAQVQANAEERKVAALAAPDAPALTEPEMDIGELTLVLQSELKRVGCDPGALDGKWGGKGRKALASFNAHAKLSLPLSTPSKEAIDAVKGKRGRICPLTCGAQYNKVGDACVKKTCGADQTLTRKGQCIKVAVTKPTPSQTAKKKPTTAKKKPKSGTLLQNCLETWGINYAAECRARYGN